MDKVIAILPLRGGSQRVIGKNMRIMAGIPLYEHILNTLLSSSAIDKIIINTDIADIINKYNNNERIIIIEREEKLSGNCSMNSVLDSTLKEISSGDLFLQVHATSPLLTKETIENAIDTFLKNRKSNDSLFSVKKIQKRFWNRWAKPINHNLKDSPTTRDIEPWYEENSSIYIFSRNSFIKNKNRIGNSPKMFEMGELESLDIDTESDLELVKKIMECAI